ncbi:MAG: DUF4920 domain-containing protein [Myxococcales bacterium]|jgi:hypothetical protein
MKMRLMIPLAALALAGCQDKPQQVTPATSTAAQAVAAAAPEKKADPAPAQEAGHQHEGNHGDEAEQHAHEGHAQHEGCTGDHGGDHGMKVGVLMPVPEHEGTLVTDPATGATFLAAGARLTGAERVSIEDLMAKPERYAGKTVRVAGNISAMCHHKRGWFALQGEGRGGEVVRVITTPAFRVPENAMGKQARAEGVVEIVAVPASDARHFAVDHKVGDPAAVKDDKPVKSVVIRATGAEFI